MNVKRMMPLQLFVATVCCRKSSKNQRGFTLLEMLGALAIGAIVLIGLNTMIDSSISDMRSQQAGLYHGKMSQAAGKYISANYSGLSSVPGVTQKLSVAQLIAAGFLPDNFSAKNAYGQTPCVLIRSVSKNIAGNVTNVINALVVTEGGVAKAIPEKDLPTVAANAGSGGGYISASSVGVARGAFGAWKIDSTTSPSLSDFLTANCSGSVAGGGSVVSALFYDGPGQLSTDFLYRNGVPGRPELNQMNTPLRMAGSAVVNEYDSCGTVAGIAVDTTNRLMFCDNTQSWKAVNGSWKPPVETLNQLPNTDHRGDVRMVMAHSRAYTFDGNKWVALAVDDAGNLSVPGNINIDKGNVNIAQGSFITNSGNISTANGDIKTSQGNLEASNGNVSTPHGGFYGQSVMADTWSYLVSVQIGQHFPTYTDCNIPKPPPDTGKFFYPVGSIVLSSSYQDMVMVCTWTGGGLTGFQFIISGITLPR